MILNVCAINFCIGCNKKNTQNNVALTSNDAISDVLSQPHYNKSNKEKHNNLSPYDEEEAKNSIGSGRGSLSDLDNSDASSSLSGSDESFGSGKNLSGSGKNLSGSGKNLSGSGKNLSGSGKNLSGSGKNLSGSGKNTQKKYGLSETIRGVGELYKSTMNAKISTIDELISAIQASHAKEPKKQKQKSKLLKLKTKCEKYRKYARLCNPNLPFEKFVGSKNTAKILKNHRQYPVSEIENIWDGTQEAPDKTLNHPDTKAQYFQCIQRGLEENRKLFNRNIGEIEKELEAIKKVSTCLLC